MVSSPAVLASAAVQRRSALRGLALLLLIAVVGLFVVKWQPYYLRSFVAASNHTLGASILSGTEAAPPPASPQAAWDYSTRYFLAIWQALVLGLLLAAAIESSVPRDLLVKGMGSRSLRTTGFGAILALPGMM